MQCRNCGTEIADKAIVCYRCGQATTDPVRRPAAIRPRRPAWVSLAAPAAALLAALVLLALASASSRPELMRAAGGILAVFGALLLIVRLMRRR
jgi:LPS O-antigen subunit length determinant protein (WzzB/FepE family)